MKYSIEMKQEKSIFRWGGLSGMAGATLFILVMVFLGIFLPSEPVDLTQFVTRFPEIKTIRVIENSVYLTALLMEVPLILALYHALRRTKSAPALFGSAFCILGILVMAASATPHVAHHPLSVLYGAAETTAADQANIAILWQAIWGIFNAMLYVGFFIVSLGLMVLGIGLLKTSVFKRGVGRIIITLGIIGLISAILQMIDPASPVGMGSYLAGLVSYFILGWQVFRLSRFSEESMG